MCHTLSRRAFLARAACGIGAGMAMPQIVTSSVLGRDGATPPGERIALGFVGLGSHGIRVNLKSFLNEPDAQVVALCDVDKTHLQDAVTTVESHHRFAGGKPPRGLFTTGDWREVVARNDVDAVVVSTPDHWHVLPSIAAARNGKDVFCEKPLTLTVHEGRVLSDAIQRHGRVFQTASENRSKQNFRRACELVRNGRIGKLQTIYSELPRGRSAYTTGGRSYEPQPVPEGFDYDMWLGPAPEAPYCPERCHYSFRWILDYSGGMVTDWGAHLNDIAQWANGTDEWQLPAIQAREHREFLDCVKSRRDTYAPAEVGHRTATVCHIGNISMLQGRKLRWDPDAERFINDDQANAMLSRVMRAPWHL